MRLSFSFYRFPQKTSSSLFPQVYKDAKDKPSTMGAKDVVDKPGYLSSKAAKFALGVHRGPMPKESFDDENDMERLEKMDTLELETIKRTPTQTLRRHWFRFWCCYLFFSIIFLAIFLPVL